MSTTRRTVEADGSAIAERLAGASFVKLVPRADGDAIAAAGTLARLLEERNVPFQVSPGRTRAGRRRRVEHTDEGLSLGIGGLDAADISLEATEVPVSTLAADVAARIDAVPDPELVLAGAFAAGTDPEENPELLDRARKRGVTQRPGLSIPTSDPVEGLAHSTLVHAEFSGDEGRTRSVLDRLGVSTEDPSESDLRTVASFGAIEATDTPGPKRAATSIERFVAPHGTPNAPFDTIGGYADVLDATARSHPGTAVALAIGGDVRSSALDVWRSHAVSVHELLRSASSRRYDGVVILETDDGSSPDGNPRPGDGVVESAARLYRDVATVEPVVCAIGGTSVGIATLPGTHAREPTVTVRDAVDGTADWSSGTGYVDAGKPIDQRVVIEALLEEP